MKHILELSWSAREELKEKYDLKQIRGGYLVYKGVLLPKELHPFRTEDYTYARWLEDEENAHVSSPVEAPRKHQFTAQEEAIAQQVEEACKQGEKSFFVSDFLPQRVRPSLLLAVAKLAREKAGEEKASIRKPKLLIVTPKSDITLWTQTLKKVPAAPAFARVLVIDYAQVAKMLTAPANARLTPKKAAKERIIATLGAPTIAWDYIIFDEFFHLRGHPKARLALAAITLARLEQEHRQASPFVIFTTSTAALGPNDFAPLASSISRRAVNQTKPAYPQEWEAFLERCKIDNKSVAKQAKVYTPEVRTIINTLEVRRGPAYVARNYITDYNYSAYPIELKGGHKIIYREKWARLRNELLKPDAPREQILTRFKSEVNRLIQSYLLQRLFELGLQKKRTMVYTTDGAFAEQLMAKLTARKQDATFVPLLTPEAAVDSTSLFTVVHHAPEEAPAPWKLSAPVDTIVITRPEDITLFSQSFFKPFTTVSVEAVTVVDSIDEKLFEASVNDKENVVTPLDATKIANSYRRAAASTVPPHRLS